MVANLQEPSLKNMFVFPCGRKNTRHDFMEIVAYDTLLEIVVEREIQGVQNKDLTKRAPKMSCE